MSKISFKNFPPDRGADSPSEPVDAFAAWADQDLLAKLSEAESESEAEAILADLEKAEPIDPKQDAAPVAESGLSSSSSGGEIAQVADEDITPDLIRTEAGLVDPETGEIIEPSLIMRKFGWSELPILGSNPSNAELETFAAKIEQVAEIVFSHQEKVRRWTAAAAIRCEPYTKAAEFYQKNFLEPMARQFAEYALPRYKSGAKKGEFSKKTLPLEAGCLQFTAKGGAFVHDAAELKRYIASEGVEKFKSIGAEPTITYSYPKLIAALNKGDLKNLPGTGVEPKNPLASVKLVNPADKHKQTTEDENNAE